MSKEPRIKYVNQMNAFLNYLSVQALPVKAQAMYLALFKINNTLRWKEKFTAPLDTIRGICRLSNNDILNMRKVLIEHELITYEKGKPGCTGFYTLLNLYEKEMYEEEVKDSGNEPGNEPGNDSGNDSGNEPGNEPGNDSGNEPGNDSGNESGNEPGNESGNGLGNDSGNESGNEPGNKGVIFFRERKEKKKEKKKEKEKALDVFKEENSEEDDTKNELSLDEMLKGEERAVKEICMHYHDNIEPLSLKVVKELRKWLGTDLDQTLICRAIDEAVIQDRQTYGFLNTLLLQWQGEGLRTRDDFYRQMETAAN